MIPQAEADSWKGVTNYSVEQLKFLQTADTTLHQIISWFP